MHIHPAGLNAINPYGLANERSANAERAAEVRKKLLKAGQTDNLEASTDPDTTLLVGHWLDSRHSQVLSGDEYDSSHQSKNSDFD